MRKEDLTSTLVDIYEEKIKGIEVFKVKPWEVKIGDKLVLRPISEISVLVQHHKTYLSFPDVSRLESFSKEYMLQVDRQILERIDGHYSRIASFKAESISLALLQKADENYTVQSKKVIETKTYSIRQSGQKSREILDEMKSKVDRKRMQKLLSISASTSEHKYFVKNDMVEQYLELWANAKYEYYIMFGNQLKIEKEVEQEITSRDMKNLINDLRLQYPKYAFWLDNFESNEYVANKVAYVNSSVRNVVDYCTVGMKLSGFFSKLFNDAKFDIELSKIMQNKHIKGYLTVSIDPYDYLTSSLNKHLWKSCHRITDGEYGTGSMSYLLDDATLIAYKHNGKDYDYNYYNFSFTGNSKTFRQCVYFDKSSCNIIFGRNYPNSNNGVSKGIRTLLQEQVCTHLGIEPNSEWYLMSEEYEGDYDDISDLHYSDVENGWSFTFARLEDSSKDVARFKVGYDVPCLICGEPASTEGECALCDDCLDERDDDDDDEDDDF